MVVVFPEFFFAQRNVLEYMGRTHEPLIFFLANCGRRILLIVTLFIVFVIGILFYYFFNVIRREKVIIIENLHAFNPSLSKVN